MMWFNQTQESIDQMTIGQWWHLCDGIDERIKQEKAAADKADRAGRRRR